jgi:hypothetical protein
MSPVSLAEFSRRYLSAGSAGHAEEPILVLRQVAHVDQNGIAEHVFLAMAKPDDNLAVTSPGVGRQVSKKSVQLRPAVL